MKTLLFLWMVLMVSTLWSQNKMVSFTSGTATGEATALIIQPIEILKESDLAFGNIAAGPSSGTVTIDVDGKRSSTGGVSLISASSISNAASFSVAGFPESSIALTLPSSVVLEYNGFTMIVDRFVSNLGTTIQLSDQGEAFISVGATLNVEPNQSPGLYSGTFEVSVAYN